MSLVDQPSWPAFLAMLDDRQLTALLMVLAEETTAILGALQASYEANPPGKPFDYSK